MFSLRTLLLSVAIAAIGAVGLTTRNTWWSSVTVTLMWTMIAAAVVGAIIGSGHRKRFCIGFAAFAALYAGVIFNQHFQPTSSMLLTHRLTGKLWGAIGERYTNPPTGLAANFPSSQRPNADELVDWVMSPYLDLTSSPQARAYNWELRNFFTIAHCLWSMLFGFLGGMFAGSLAGKQPSIQLRTSRPGENTPSA